MPYSLQTSKRQLRNATTLHEANFRKLSHVVPDLNELEDLVHLNAESPTHTGDQSNTRLTLQLLEVSKYTKTFSLHLQQNTSQPWLPGLSMKIRNYYDAGVTEVLAFQHQHRFDARYAYPNSKMHQRNEKWQSNDFLREWLDHCIKTRCVFRKILTPLKIDTNPDIS